MKRVYWFIEGRLAGREGPIFGLPWDLADLRAGGIHSILTLAEDQHDPEIESRGFRHLRAALPDVVPPNEHVERLCLERVPSACEFIVSELGEGRTVLVHCAAGRDRTGLVLAAYACMTNGLGAEESIARVRAVQPEALSAPGWEAMAVRVLRALVQ